MVPVSSMLQGCPNTFNQQLVVEGLREELHGTCSQRMKPHFFITVCRDEDRRNPATFSVQSGLQIQAGHSWHPDISN
jgi:hypothetical protein